MHRSCNTRPISARAGLGAALGLAGAVILAAAPVAAELPRRGPDIAGASNMSQGRQKGMLSLADRLGIRDYRDGFDWNRAEPAAGSYVFDNIRTTYPADLEKVGAVASVNLNWGNGNYDGGDTPHSPEAIAAFGRFAGELVERFDAIEAIEIGNEFNGRNFVRGPLREMKPLQRARAYVPLLEAAAREIRREDPEIRISGGATHSIAVGYLWEVLDTAEPGVMDTLAIHPYTTPAEQFVRQIEVLRRHPRAAELPLEITEFGTPDSSDSANHFLRNYCQFALGGTLRAAWYPLSQRGDGMVPLFYKDGRISPAGRAVTLALRHFEGRPVEDAAQGDGFTYGCRFGSEALVLWGAPRAIEPAPGLQALAADGRAWEGALVLDPVRPIVFVAGADGALPEVSLASQSLRAESYHQFAYPLADEAQAEGDGFARVARWHGEERPLETLPGQQRSGVPWFPYRGNTSLGSVRLTAESMLPWKREGQPVEIVHRYTATARENLDLTARFAPSDRSMDGITLRITVNGETLHDDAGAGPFEIDRLPVDLARGDELEIVVGPGASTDGDVTAYRMSLSVRGPVQ